MLVLRFRTYQYLYLYLMFDDEELLLYYFVCVGGNDAESVWLPDVGYQAC